MVRGTPYTNAVTDTSLIRKLVPLDVAVKLVWSKVYEGKTPAARKEEILDSLATTFSVSSTLYEYHTGGQIPPRALDQHELDGGLFKGGGRELHFSDGRQPRRNLAVMPEEISAAIEALKASRAP